MPFVALHLLPQTNVQKWSFDDQGTVNIPYVS